VGLYYGLIQSQKESLDLLGRNSESTGKKLLQIRQTIENADKIEAQLAESTRQLAHIEESMASGDLYSWFIDTIRQFKLSYKVEVPQVSQPSVGDVNLLPEFPYRQSTAVVVGTAYYQDLGKFVADFENHFPCIRIVNLNVEPASTGSGEEEKLSFRMDIVALVKPNHPN
jgi:hypothetical protein